jgi:hypothetical protein
MFRNELNRRPTPTPVGRTGVVTMAGETLAVRLEREVRAPELYGPAGYRWAPKAGDRVLVIKGEGETPCVVGVGQGSAPARVDIEADTVALQGAVLINGVPLEQYITALIAAQASEGTE